MGQVLRLLTESFIFQVCKLLHPNSFLKQTAFLFFPLKYFRTVLKCIIKGVAFYTKLYRIFLKRKTQTI